MLTNPYRARRLLVAVLAATLSTGTGCTLEFGGGASTVPTVTILRAGGETEEIDDDEPFEVAGYGTFTGRIVLEGNRPSLPPLVSGNVPAADAATCQIGIISQNDYRLIVDEETGGIKNVFVYLARKPRGTKAAEASEPEKVTFDQKTCMYEPHAMILQIGQTLQLINSDPIAHNVHTHPNRNDGFNSVLKVSDSVGVPYVYRAAERVPVRVSCDLHTWMLAWQLPLDHPYGAVTPEDGSFSIPDLPAGEHKFVVWHEGNKLLDYTVTIEPDQTVDETISITPASLALRPNANPRTVVLSVAGP